MEPKSKKYTSKKLSTALNDIRTGKLKVLEASKLYSIPRTTLYFKLSGERPEELRKPGPQSILGENIEKKLEKWLLDILNIGFSPGKDSLQYSVKKILEECSEDVKIKLPFKNNMPGRKWFRCFKSRHPQIMEKLDEYKNKNKSIVNETTVRDLYSKIHTLLVQKGISDVLHDPDRIFYMEEVCIYINGKGEIMLTDKKKAIHSISQNYKENVTVLFVVNASGSFICPLALYRSEEMQASEDDLCNWTVQYSNSGWMNCETFYEYVSGSFYSYLQKSSITLPVIVYVDSNFSCMSFPLSDFCEQQGIYFFSTIAKMSRFLGPLDEFFRILKNGWHNEWQKCERETSILTMVYRMMKNEVSKKLVLSGLQSSGLHPLDSENITFTEDNSIEQEYVNSPAPDTYSNANSVIEYIESKIPANVLEQFRLCSISNTHWTGYVGYSALYDVWQDILRDSKGSQTLSSQFLFPEIINQKSETNYEAHQIKLETNMLDKFVDEIEIIED